ncbi:MAG: amino acid racemase [Thermodesulfobacteriota bacterium]|nr:amino acid racemase [Thermodesulfobacteriota bacterium]
MKEKIIGILGGMGPEATLYMFERILANTPASKDQEHLRVIIDNNPKIPERLPAILGAGENPVPMMVESGLSLKRAGVDFIVIPCVSAHFFLKELKQGINLPILSIVDKTAEYVKFAHPNIKTLGLLAAEGAIRGELFQDRFGREAIKVLLPEAADLQKLMAAIFRIKNTKAGLDRKIIKEELKEISYRLINKGAEGIIVGCTEISIVVGPGDLNVPIFDALTILARAAIEEAGIKPCRN